MGPKDCASSLRCFAKLLFRKAVLCSLYRIVKLQPVCPTYFFLKSGQVSLYTPDCESISGQGFCEKVDSIWCSWCGGLF